MTEILGQGWFVLSVGIQHSMGAKQQMQVTPMKKYSNNNYEVHEVFNKCLIVFYGMYANYVIWDIFQFCHQSYHHVRI